MTIKEMLQDIRTTGLFNSEELEHVESDKAVCFRSDEFYEILYFSNQEMYYLDGETQDTLDEIADVIEDTPLGRIYCFK